MSIKAKKLILYNQNNDEHLVVKDNPGDFKKAYELIMSFLWGAEDSDVEVRGLKEVDN